MTILKRFGNLLRADVHGILDCLEEPGAVVKQCIREMQEEIQRLETAERMLAERSAENERAAVRMRASIAAIDREVDICLSEGNDALARTVVRRKLESERRAARVRSHGDMLERERTSTARRLEEFRDKLRQVEERYEMLASCEEPGEDIGAVSDAEVEVALLRERARRNEEGGTGR